MLCEALERILREWPAAVRELYTGHPLANFIRTDFVSIVTDIIKQDYPNFVVVGGAGAGTWPNVPWLSILNPVITTTTQDGIYPVYLFCADGSGVYLSFNQGTTRPTQQLGRGEADRQASLYRSAILQEMPELCGWGIEEITLNATTALGKSYERPNIVARFYPVNSLPSETDLVADLLWMMKVNQDVVPLWKRLKGETEGQAEGPIPPSIPNRDNNVPPINGTDSYLTLPKPFLLLAGISGTGKTRFVREQAKSSAEAYGITDRDNYCLVPVRPDWHEPSDLLGYVSRIGGGGARYVTTEVLTFIVAAWKHAALSADAAAVSLKDINGVCPFWLCLDEMNLAPVEQYFADYLSILETRKWENNLYTCDPLLKAATIKHLDDLEDFWKKLQLGEDTLSSGLKVHFLEKGIALPPNLIVAGTVNMDETTHGFSRKVIDRALTIDFGEFFPNDFGAYYSADRTISSRTLNFPRLSFVQAEGDLVAVPADPDGRKTIAFLTAVNGLLHKTPFALAYRALNEILLCVASLKPADDIALKAVWDDYLMMKVLPRIEGDADKLSFTGDESLLTQLQSILKEQLGIVWDGKTRPDLFRKAIAGPDQPVECRSRVKLMWMQKRLVENSFTSFWP